MAYPASLIAFAFVKKGIDEGKFVTQMKLQKLVYFAQGYHLAKYHEPLINETFQAWMYGPVIPEIYQDFKLYGSRPITDTAEVTPSASYKPPFRLDDRALESINYTWGVLKDFSAMSLSHWTHQPNGPWSKVYNPDAKSTPIHNDEIQHYFEKLLIKA
ncbi:Panacea domain-containing protein [Longitalea luteola]|uniref:Panacea domain-containing protein n=1 Tax=Longitalea luteola TaxID=2812563 RepID=UPI001A961C34|nr:type II toxin-antitoxin system antitoxin SocA domain-containing protein [Longitalea luteola]